MSPVNTSIESPSPLPRKAANDKPVVADRYLALDAVRGFAILLVICYHAAYRFSPDAGDVIAKFLRIMGWIGVDVFFALSGFLIVKILMRDASRADIYGFFVRRFFRIVPLFAVAILVFGAASFATGHNTDSLDRLWMTALFLNGWVIPYYGFEKIPFTITWSLSVELFAYLALGAAASHSNKSLRALVWAFLITAITVRLGILMTNHFDPAHLHVFVPARLDAIAFGGLAAYGTYSALIKFKNSSVVLGTCIIGLMVAFQWTPVDGFFLPAFGYSIFGLVCAMWIAALVTSRGTSNNPIVNFLAPLGKVSYFVYLFHLFVLEALLMLQAEMPGFKISFWLAAGITSFLTYLLAAASWRYFESPIITLGHRFATKRQTPESSQLSPSRSA